MCLVTGTHGSEGAGRQQCRPATRPPGDSDAYSGPIGTLIFNSKSWPQQDLGAAIAYVAVLVYLVASLAALVCLAQRRSRFRWIGSGMLPGLIVTGYLAWQALEHSNF